MAKDKTEGPRGFQIPPAVIPGERREGMPKVTVEEELLRVLLGQRDALVQAITAGMQSGEWDQVMGPFNELLIAIKRLEEEMQRGEHPST